MINILDELKDFPLQSRFQEVVFRGLYLRTAADVDMILTMIIVECFGYNSDEIKSYYSFANGKPKDVQNLTMSQKIEICKKGLQKYYPDFYLTLENDFKVFDKLRDYRNKFAHEKMEFFENDKGIVRFTKVIENYQTESYDESIPALWKELNDYIISIMNVMGTLKSIVEKRESD